MKYFNSNLSKKLISLLLSAFLALSFCACGGDTEESSKPESVTEAESESSQPPQEFDIVLATQLLANDRKVIEIFINGGLCSDKSTALPTKALESSGYSDYSAIEALLAETYAAGSEATEYFLAYPGIGENAIINRNGETFAAFHKWSKFSDYAVTSDLAISQVDESTRLIKFNTVSGKEVELKALLSNGKWLLENSLCRVLEPETDSSEPLGSFPLSYLGSLPDLGTDILVIELFYSDNSIKFTEQEENDFHFKISNAVSYLVNQANDFGKETFVTYEKAYFDHRGSIGEHELSFDLIFAETGFGTLQKFAEKNYDTSLYSGYLFFVCMNTDRETSFNAYRGEPVANEDPELYYAERIFVGSESTESQLATAMLQLLGSPDFASDSSDKYLSELYKSYFPNDPFCKSSLQDSQLSPVAAYACGISSELDPMFEIFIK